MCILYNPYNGKYRSGVLELPQVGDDLRAMAVGIDLAIDLGDVPGRIDDKGVASRYVDEQERPIGVIALGDVAVVVGQQGKGSLNLVANLSWLSVLSRLMPSNCTPMAWSVAMSSRKWQASLVQPGVSSLG